MELDRIDSRLLIGRNFISSFWVMMAEAAGLFDEGTSGGRGDRKNANNNFNGRDYAAGYFMRLTLARSHAGVVGAAAAARHVIGCFIIHGGQY